MENNVTSAPNTTASVMFNYDDVDKIDKKMMEQYMFNRKVDEPAYHILIVMYSILILVGAIGNTLVVSYFYLLLTIYPNTIKKFAVRGFYQTCVWHYSRDTCMLIENEIPET